MLKSVKIEDHALLAHASSFDDQIAAERGRLFAARAIIENPEQRKTVESALGLRYCMMRWPEAYSNQETKAVIQCIPGFGEVNG